MPPFDVHIQVYDSVDPNQAKALDVFQRALSGTVERLSGVPFLPAELSTATNGRVVMQRSLSLPGNCTVLVHYTNLAAIHHPTVSRAAERCIRGIAAHAPGLVVRLLPTTTDAEQQYEEPSQPAPAVAAPLDSDTDSGTDSDEGEEPETTKSSSWLPYVAAGVAVGMAATLMSAEGDGEEDEAPLSAAAAAAAAAAGAP